LIQQVDVYTSRPGATALPLAARPELDTFYVANGENHGLDPVKITVDTVSLGSIEGEMHIGDTVPSRNIVLTLRPNTNYINWTSEQFRRFLAEYFTPKSIVRLVFTTDEIPDPVEISGIVEAMSNNPFSDTLEFQISIICPDPYFKSTVQYAVSGSTNGGLATIENPGDVAGGFFIRVQSLGTDSSDFVQMEMGDPAFNQFRINDMPINSGTSLEVSSERLNKFVHEVTAADATFANVFVRVERTSEFLVLEPGTNSFAITTDTGGQNWEIVWYPRYDGL
jgi:phage-related protein